MPNLNIPIEPSHAIFISHVEEDATIALELSRSLDAAGYATWCYEEDAVGGSYLEVIAKAIEDAKVFLVLITQASLVSEQVIKEVERAHESGKCFLPVRYGISHDDIQGARGIWRMAIGTSLSVEIPSEGVPTAMPKLIRSLETLNIGSYNHHSYEPSKYVPMRKQELRDILKLVPQRTRFIVYLFLAAFLIYAIFGRNFILGRCVIKDADGGETPFREGAVSFVVGSQEVKFDLRHNGYFAFPLESRLPLRGVELIFERNDSQAHYPVKLGLASIIMNERQTVYLRPGSNPLFKAASVGESIGGFSLVRAAYAQQPARNKAIRPRTADSQADLKKTIALTSSILKVDASKITPKVDIRKDLHADSVALSRLVDNLEISFGILIEAKDWDRLGTVEEIAAYVSGKRRLLRGVKEDIIGTLQAYLSDYQKERFYFEPSIPGPELATARKAAEVPSNERIFAMFDATLFGTGSDALLFGNRGFYFSTNWTASGPGRGFVGYENFASRSFKREDWSEVSLDNGQYFAVTVSRLKSKELANLLNILAQAVKRRIDENTKNTLDTTIENEPVQ